MQIIWRKLLFVFCIISCWQISALAIEITTEPIPQKIETLEKEYVQINISENQDTISILRSVDSILRLVKDRYYSLLNWSQHSRTQDLVVENYDRKLKFGRWINDPNDETCYNTRARVLLRDSNKEVVFKENNHCSVATGQWNDPYTGLSFKSSEDLQIDHMVPLKNAYLSGAYKWNFKSRCLYANFLGAKFHLLPVNASQNMKKGDRAPDKYIPPNSEYTCTYIKNWLTIKFLWGLRMTVPEAQSIVKTINDNHCNLRSMYISGAEILKQSRIYQETIDLCEKLDKENQ